MAAHHSYIEIKCENCGNTRIARKDVATKTLKDGKRLLCHPCAIKLRPVTWKKKEEHELLRNQGAYKSYCRAKRRVKINHNGAYSSVEFRFSSYEQFLEELGPRPDGMTLDRIDSTGHYEPGNVRWATMKEQSRNRKSNIFVNYNGQKMCISEAAKLSGVTKETIKVRMKKGYPESMLFLKWRIDLDLPADLKVDYGV